MIQESYVSFETAKLLKEKGFNERTFTYYEVEDEEYVIRFHQLPIANNFSDEYPRATHQMVLAWLRAQGVHIDITTSFDLNGKDHYSYTIYQNGKLIRKEYTYFDWYYEEATESAIKYSLENLI